MSMGCLPYIMNRDYVEHKSRKSELELELELNFICSVLLALYELSDDVKRKEWLDDWLGFMHRIAHISFTITVKEQSNLALDRQSNEL
uniref:PDEase domain-containing protein n=1 Tax=Syphacia muris TaxID=451379 RepID=A0A0N5AQT8_9BILA